VSAPAQLTELVAEPPPEGLAEAGVYASYRAGFEHSVVVLAMGRPCWLVSDLAAHRLLVEPAALAAVRSQLARYDRESVGWPPAPVSAGTPTGANGLFDALLWAAAVLAIFRFGARFELAERGLLDAAAVLGRGEWWRVATALFLHADAEHIVSNLLPGMLVVAAVITTLGRWRGWLLLAGASIAANVALVLLSAAHPYRSLGSSTGIFAGLGLLVGGALRRAGWSRHPHRWRSVFVPVAAGLTVLALYGAGGVRVDVLAHVVGFLAGALAGFLLAARRET
jgi:membrane associated rhomboid family serine protease